MRVCKICGKDDEWTNYGKGLLRCGNCGTLSKVEYKTDKEKLIEKGVIKNG